jgi:SAM-dependent methyltransferase
MALGVQHPQAAFGPPGAYAPGGSSSSCCITTHSHCAWTNEGGHVTCTSQDFGDYKDGEFFGQKQSPRWDASRCDLLCDITSPPVADGLFDHVHCTQVFKHLPEPQLALRELARMLKPGGCRMLTAPFGPSIIGILVSCIAASVAADMSIIRQSMGYCGLHFGPMAVIFAVWPRSSIAFSSWIAC